MQSNDFPPNGMKSKTVCVWFIVPRDATFQDSGNALYVPAFPSAPM
jgi:hypothetical protein